MRTVLGVFAVGAAHALNGCGSTPENAIPVLRVPLSDLPLGERVIRTDLDVPVEILRTESDILARSLLCTHFGCIVEWKPALQEYHCPCHEGRFGPDGAVLFGPPKAPLRMLPVRIEGDAVLIEVPPVVREGPPASA
jgi:Rieske Fe-S protein